MSAKISRGPGRPPVDSERVDARLPRDMLDALDAYMKREGYKTRPEAVREALRDYFIGLGMIPPAK